MQSGANGQQRGYEVQEQDRSSFPLPIIKLETRSLDVFSGKRPLLSALNMTIPERQVTAVVGPSGSGKSLLLRTLNRLSDLLPGIQVRGQILLDGADITQLVRNSMDLLRIRQRVGLLFPMPNPFPGSIFDNIAYGIRLRERLVAHELQQRVEWQLRQVALWHEVKDRLDRPAVELASGQQQLLCLARLLALSPEVLLLDEPWSLLDPETTHHLEKLVVQLGYHSTVIIATSHLDHAHRIARTIRVLPGGQLAKHRRDISSHLSRCVGGEWVTWT